MSPTQCDPYHSLEELVHDRNRLSLTSEPRPSTLIHSTSVAEAAETIDIVEGLDEYVITMACLQNEQENVRVEIANSTLRISGGPEHDEEHRGDKAPCADAPSRSFLHIFALPEHVDEETIATELKDGVLTVRLKKRGNACP